MTETQEQSFREYVKEAFKNAAEILWTAKNNDYNSGGVKITDYFDYEGKEKMPEKIFHEVWKKTLRLRSLIFSGKKPKNEALEDNCLDLMNYAAFLYAALRLRKTTSAVCPKLVPSEYFDEEGQEESDC